MSGFHRMEKRTFCDMETRRLNLRRLTFADATRVMEMSQEPMSRIWLANQVCETIGQAREVIGTLIGAYDGISCPLDQSLVVGIEEKKTGELIGHVGLSPFRNLMEIGYGIAEAYVNRGFASEAVVVLTEWGLKKGGLTSVCGLVDSHNPASKRVLEKCGYRLQGVFPGRTYGKKNDCWLYEIRNSWL